MIIKKDSHGVYTFQYTVSCIIGSRCWLKNTTTPFSHKSQKRIKRSTTRNATILLTNTHCCRPVSLHSNKTNRLINRISATMPAGNNGTATIVATNGSCNQWWWCLRRRVAVRVGPEHARWTAATAGLQTALMWSGCCSGYLSSRYVKWWEGGERGLQL